MVTSTRSRLDIMRDLAEARWWAGRMSVVDADYGLVHEEINALLDELGL